MQATDTMRFDLDDLRRHLHHRIDRGEIVGERVARALLQPLLDEVDRHQLACWEPELAAQAWRLQCRACRAVVDALAARGDSASLDQATEQWRQALARLAEVDFGAAAELSRSP